MPTAHLPLELAQRVKDLRTRQSFQIKAGQHPVAPQGPRCWSTPSAVNTRMHCQNWTAHSFAGQHPARSTPACTAKTGQHTVGPGPRTMNQYHQKGYIKFETWLTWVHKSVYRSAQPRANDPDAHLPRTPSKRAGKGEGLEDLTTTTTFTTTMTSPPYFVSGFQWAFFCWTIKFKVFAEND